MTTLNDSRNLPQAEPVVNFDEPPVKPPPLLAVGPLAWIQKNLFSTPLDALLTVVGVTVVAGAIAGFLGWAIGQANWLAINFNLRLFLLGRFEPEAEWRVTLLMLLVAFTIGLSFAAWARLTRGVLLALAVIVALTFVLPPLFRAALPVPATYLAAGEVGITAGADTITPQPQLAFIARAGESITIRLADSFSGDDASLGGLSGFADDAANQLRNAALNRLEDAARIDEVTRLLAGDLLTSNQRTQLEEELAELSVPDPITDTYSLNDVAVQVRILRGTTGEEVGAARLEGSTTFLNVTLPEDGWYILEKRVDAGTGNALVRADGIFPLLERTVTRSVEESGEGRSGSIAQYARLTDSFVTEEIRPAVDGRNLPMATIIDNQLRGSRSFTEYLSLFVAPFLGQINTGVLALVAAMYVGYFGGQALDRMRSPAQAPRRTSGRLAAWLWMALPVLMFVFVYGLGSILPLTDTRRWGGLMLTIMLAAVGIIASFPLGVLLALGRRSSLPIVSLISTLYIEFVRGVPLITVLFMAQLLVPLVNPTLAELPNVFRAMIGIILFSAAYLAENVRGGLQSIPPGQEEAAKALGLNGLQITLQITLPQALRAVLPALVGQFISLFKDTSLVAIVGLLDFSAMGELIVTQTEFLGLRREVYIFLIVFYFAFTYSIASVSRRIEASGAGKALARKI
jgi:His/Glu/Gln/Arg/opine family amino acid ABC transporter permease subunit